MWKTPYETPVVCNIVTEYNIVFELWLAKIHLALFDLFSLYACYVQATFYTTASNEEKMFPEIATTHIEA